MSNNSSLKNHYMDNMISHKKLNKHSSSVDLPKQHFDIHPKSRNGEKLKMTIQPFNSSLIQNHNNHTNSNHGNRSANGMSMTKSYKFHPGPNTK